MDVYGLELVGKILRTPIKDHGVKLLLVAIAQSTAPGGKTAQISNQSLQIILQRSQNVIRELTNKAINERLLHRTPTVKPDGRQGANTYRIIVSAMEKLLNGSTGTPLNSGGYPDDAHELIRKAPLNSGAYSDMSEQPINQKAPLNSGAYSDMFEQRPMTTGDTLPLIAYEGTHARAGSGVHDHELNLNELNSEQKFSTAPRASTKIAKFNAARAAQFEPDRELRKWAARICPLVPLETATAQWREFVHSQMSTRLKEPVAHWRDYLKKQQAWREAEIKERNGLFVGVAETPTMPAATADVPTGAADWERQLDAAFAALPDTERAALRQQVETQLRAKVGERFDFIWEPETRERTIQANLRKLMAEQQAAQRMAA